MTKERIVWGAWILTMAIVVAAIWLAILNETKEQPWLEQVLIPAQSVAYTTVGLLISRRHPENAMGWLFLMVGFFAGAYALSFESTTYALVTSFDSIDFGQWVAWVQAWLYVPALGVSFLFVPLLFPTGRPPSERWRPVLWLASAAIVAVTLSDALSPGPIDQFPVTNPVALSPGAHSILELSVPLLFGPATLLCVSALIVRWRRARGDERQQLKWLALAAAFLPVSAISWALVDLFSLSGEILDLYEAVLATLAFLGLPIATGIAILRYRLYEIDRIISQTLAYGLLSAILAGAYLLAVLALQSILPIDDDSPLIVAASTLAVVAAFGPLRTRIRMLVDRRFNRSRYDAEQTIAEFGVRLRSEVEIESLSGDLAGVINRTMQPAHVSVWLRPTGKRP